MTFTTHLKTALTAAILALGLSTQTAEAQSYRGGGTMYDVLRCEAQTLTPGQMVLAQMSVTKPINTLNLFFGTNRAVSIRFNDPFARSASDTRGWGAGITGTATGWNPRPRMRSCTLAVIEPPGASVANPTDIRMRLRVINDDGLPDCRVMTDLAL